MIVIAIVFVVGAVLVAVIFVLGAMSPSRPTMTDGSVSFDARGVSRRLEAMRRTGTSRIATAPTEGPVELTGAILPIENATLVAPLSGAACVFWRVAVDRVNGSSRDPVFRASDARDFHVRDGSGAVARVASSVMSVPLATWIADKAHEEAVIRLLAARGIDASTHALSWLEERLEPGALVYVLGEARPPRAPNAGTHRRTSSTIERLVVVAPEDGDLLVSVGNEAQLAAHLRGGRRMIALVSVLVLWGIALFGATFQYCR